MNGDANEVFAFGGGADLLVEEDAMGQGIASVRQGDDESIEEDTAGVEDEDEELEAGADFAVKIAKEGDAGRFDAELSYDVFELSIALNAAPLTYQV